MVQVSFYADGGHYRLKLDGHAGYNPGNDIVCAAVSSLVFALLGYLANATEHITDRTGIKCAPGSVDIDVTGDDMLLPAFETAYIGLSQIADKYPDNVNVD
jgi:uncharacterized protein YsxB (DUF464 family)